MDIKNSVLKLIIFGLLLASSCSQKPRMRFTEKWRGNAVESWRSSKISLTYEEFDEDELGRYFVLMIRGNLPLGEINLKAIKIEDNGERETAAIFPDKIENDDPKADFFALRVRSLLTKEDIKANLKEFFGSLLDSDFTLRDLRAFSKGKFYIYLEKNGEEIVGSEVTIK
ncbi:MAG: hypothetical protein QMD82_02225 [bacterium]|nr:hypothetical protein [bacterium]